jgi:hypothetical protein
MNTLTLDGVDVMGQRLADEVSTKCNIWRPAAKYLEATWSTILILLKWFCGPEHFFTSEIILYPHFYSLVNQVLDVISRKPELTKISFLAHSVGGLVARYAIAKLYRHPNSTFDSKAEGTICGLEALNFITVATPHLGSRGNKQVLCWLIFLMAPLYFSILTIMWVQICLFKTMKILTVDTWLLVSVNCFGTIIYTFTHLFIYSIFCYVSIFFPTSYSCIFGVCGVYKILFSFASEHWIHMKWPKFDAQICLLFGKTKERRDFNFIL